MGNRGIFARGDIETAAEQFVEEALKALEVIWEPDDIYQEAKNLTDRAFGWRREMEEAKIK